MPKTTTPRPVLTCATHNAPMRLLGVRLVCAQCEQTRKARVEACHA